MPPVPGSEVLILGTNRRRPPDAPELGTFRLPPELTFQPRLSENEEPFQRVDWSTRPGGFGWQHGQVLSAHGFRGSLPVVKVERR
jgi:hypothetical protein